MISQKKWKDLDDYSKKMSNKDRPDVGSRQEPNLSFFYIHNISSSFIAAVHTGNLGLLIRINVMGPLFYSY